jgi:Big-like domain-containing protein/putative metal-binding protein/VCBS repeat protein
MSQIGSWRALALLGFSISALLGGAACSKSGAQCVDDRTCGTHMRCSLNARTGIGACEKCGDTEIIYNGIDDDCDSRTKDIDLDGDGFNARSSVFMPGDDCNDMDPLIHPNAPKNCANGKDNDCNGMVDMMEPGCGDMRSPDVMFTAPTPNARLSGTVQFMVTASDDTGIAKIELLYGSMSLGSVTNMNALSVSVATQSLPDGDATFFAEATDLAMKKSSATVHIFLDNHSPPTITVNRPNAGGRYAGRMTVDVTAADDSGVKAMRLLVDTSTLATSTAAHVRAVVDTAPLSEGQHRIRVVATDMLDNTGSSFVPFVIDRGGPSVMIDASPINPNNGSIGGRQVTITVNADDPAGILSISSRLGTMMEHTGTSSPLQFMLDTLGPPRIPDGLYTITAMARDGTIIDDAQTGNLTVRTATVQIINTAPEPIVALTPQNGWGVFRNTAIHADVSSPTGSAITGVQFAVNGVDLGPPDTMPPYDGTFDFSGYSGTATITAVATDAARYMGLARSVVSIVPPPTFRLANVARPGGMAQINMAGYDIGDIDGDRVPDAVIAGSDVEVMTGTISPSGKFVFKRGVHIGDAAVTVKLANVNIDPLPEIIALTNNTVVIYDNLGHFTFGAPDVHMTGVTSGSDLEVADLDNDRFPDFVIGLQSSNGGDIRVLTHATGYNMGTTFGLVGNVTDVAIGNLNNDMSLDVVVGRTGSSVITSYINLGMSPIFGAGTESYPPMPAETVAIGDVTGDGFPDVVATIPQLTSFCVLRGAAATPGQFMVAATIGTQNNPTGVALADLDGNSRLDVVISLLSGSGIDVFSNDGMTMFRRAHSFVFGRNSLRPKLVDLDGDGDLEAIVSSQVENGLVYAENLGGGDYLAAPTIVLPQAPNSIAAGNLLGDPLPELAVTAVPGSGLMAVATVHILENQSGVFHDQVQLPLNGTMSNPAGIAIGDLDQQFGLDIAVGSQANSMMTPTSMLFLSNGTGGFNPPVGLMLSSPISVAIGDVDNDMVPDVVFTENLSQVDPDGAVIFDAMGSQKYMGCCHQGIAAASVAIGSLNNYADSFTDFAVANPTTNDVTVNYWDSTIMNFRTITYNTLTNINALTIGRVGRDSIFDIVGVSQGAGVVILEGNLAAGFASPKNYDAGPSPQYVVGGDFNRDGLYDVMVLNPGASTASLLIASPQGGFFAPVAFPAPQQPSGFAVADFDADNRQDIGVVASSAPSVMLLYSNGDRL